MCSYEGYGGCCRREKIVDDESGGKGGPGPPRNTTLFLAEAKEQGESTEYASENADYWTGTEIWCERLRAALKANPSAALTYLSGVGSVRGGLPDAFRLFSYVAP